MNRGNLAEDPKAGLSSSSRYSRNGGETNSLLYVDSSSLRKERRAAERRAAKRGSAVKGNQNSGNKTSVGRHLANSHTDRLEVGSDGRLFQVKESPKPSTSRQNAAPDPAAAIPANTSFTNHIIASGSVSPAGYGQDIRPAITAGVVSDAALDITAASVTEAAKPQRDYLTQGNPLLAVHSAGGGTAGLSAFSFRSFLHRYRAPIIAAAAALASAGYGYTAYHYRNRFYPGTEFFGIQAAEQSVYDVKAAVKAKVDSYTLELKARNPQDAADSMTASSTDIDASGDAHAAAENRSGHIRAAEEPKSGNVIFAGDVGMVYRDNGEIDHAMETQKSWAWPFMMIAQLMGEGNSALETSYDDGMVPEALARLDCMQKENMIQPQDARVVLTDDGAKVQTEIYGTTLNIAKTEEAVRKALNEGSTQIDLDDLGLYENPEIHSSDLDLTKDAMAMNRILGAKILMRFGSRTEVINSEVISKFLDKKNGAYTLNEDRVKRYISRLAKKYDTYQCKRTFFTSIGTKVQLEAGIGDYGWQLDQDATFEKVLEAIRGQKKTTMDPVYSQEAYCREANDIGDTYVEISLTNQKMWFYKDGELVVETPVVTGNPYAGHETPSGGVWSLKGKMRNQTLSGQGYNSPVDYWMPFNGGVGIHDMQSRAWFGGSIYLGSGSHGCINTPLAAVKLIYDRIEDGVPVIVYKDESEEALSMVTGPADAWTINAQVEETYGSVEDDGIGSIVQWSRYQAAQAASAAAAQSAASAGTTAS